MTTSLSLQLLSGERLAAFDAALDSMETALTLLASVDGDDRGRFGGLGASSELFCRQVSDALDWFPQALPEDVDADDVRAEITDDLRAIERLRLRRDRLQRLVERADDALVALGSDVMETAMEGYVLLAQAGHGQSVTALGQRGDRKRTDAGRA